MSNTRLEVYLNSYRDQPFVTELKSAHSISKQVEENLCAWITAKTGQSVDIARQLKVEDVQHRKPTLSQFETTCMRVKLVS
jgi:hypothetical protein